MTSCIDSYGYYIDPHGYLSYCHECGAKLDPEKKTVQVMREGDMLLALICHLCAAEKLDAEVVE